MYICVYVFIYIYMWCHPPATHTPLKNTVNTDTNAVFPNPILELFLQIGNTGVKHK